MRDSSPKFTPCELLRMINDLCQGDSDKDKRIRELCGACEKQTKRLGQEVNKYNYEIWKEDKWWPVNVAWRRKGRQRAKDNYKYNTGKEFFKRHRKK